MTARVIYPRGPRSVERTAPSAVPTAMLQRGALSTVGGVRIELPPPPGFVGVAIHPVGLGEETSCVHVAWTVNQVRLEPMSRRCGVPAAEVGHGTPHGGAALCPDVMGSCSAASDGARMVRSTRTCARSGSHPVPSWVDAARGPRGISLGGSQPPDGERPTLVVVELTVENVGDEGVWRVVLLDGFAGAVGPREEEPHAGLRAGGVPQAPEWLDGCGDPAMRLAIAFEGGDPLVQACHLVRFESV